ncbi:Uncharacterised protein [Enterobacter hormaechei]|nr:Uncharacterised protein [Enterobacter hormaechei]
MGREVAQRQRAAMLDFTSFEAHIRIHHVPFVGFEAVIGQHFTRRLNVLFNLFRLRAFARIYANQRTKIGQTQLAGFNVPLQFRARFTGGVGQRAVDIAVADAAVESTVVKDGRFFGVDFGNQVPVRFKRRSIRQQYAGEIVQFPQRITGKLKLEVDAAHVHRVVNRAHERHAGIARAEIRLHRERRALAPERQHAADFAFTGERLAVVAPFRRQAKDVIARFAVIAFGFAARYFAKRQRLAQRIDEDLHVSLTHFIVNGDPPPIEQNIVEAERPRRGLRILIFIAAAGEIERPIVVFL